MLTAIITIALTAPAQPPIQWPYDVLSDLSPQQRTKIQKLYSQLHAKNVKSSEKVPDADETSVATWERARAAHLERVKKNKEVFHEQAKRCLTEEQRDRVNQEFEWEKSGFPLNDGWYRSHPIETSYRMEIQQRGIAISGGDRADGITFVLENRSEFDQEEITVTCKVVDEEGVVTKTSYESFDKMAIGEKQKVAFKSIQKTHGEFEITVTSRPIQPKKQNP